MRSTLNIELSLINLVAYTHQQELLVLEWKEILKGGEGRVNIKQGREVNHHSEYTCRMRTNTKVKKPQMAIFFHPTGSAYASIRHADGSAGSSRSCTSGPSLSYRVHVPPMHKPREKLGGNLFVTFTAVSATAARSSPKVVVGNAVSGHLSDPAINPVNSPSEICSPSQTADSAPASVDSWNMPPRSRRTKCKVLSFLMLYQPRVAC